MASAAAVLLEARRAAAALRDGAATDLLALAGRAAERILERALALDPKLCVEVCAEALRELKRVRAAVVRVHPADEPLLAAELRRLRALAEGAELTLVPDPSVRRGGCLVSADAAEVDARIETQLSALERALLSTDGA
jgi:flagellar biosynthesis/type III secretory pathway protein FliH